MIVRDVVGVSGCQVWLSLCHLATCVLSTPMICDKFPHIQVVTYNLQSRDLAKWQQVTSAIEATSHQFDPERHPLHAIPAG